MSTRSDSAPPVPDQHASQGRALLAGWKRVAHRLRVDVYALYLASRDPRVPWYAKTMAALVAGYAFSPIDLIPDFIPVLGYVDDLVLLPLGVILTVKLIPRPVWEECQARARKGIEAGPRSRVAAVVILVLWLLLLGVAAFYLWPLLQA